VTVPPGRRVRELLERAVAAGLFSGVAASWGTAGESPSLCVTGRAEIRPRQRVLTEDTWFDLASLTKPLATTTLALVAFRSGVLAPRTRVGEVLRETDGSPVGDLEVRHLLTHASGLPAWLPLYSLAEGRRHKVVDVLQLIPVEAAPGTRVVYSCVGFIVLGLMLEQLSDTSFEEMFRREILVPKRLEDDLGFNPDPGSREVAGGAARAEAEERLVRALGFDPRWIPPVGHGLADDGNARFFGGAAGNAGLFGNLRGVHRLTSEYLGRDAVVLTPDDVRPALSSQTSGLEQERGFGWQNATSQGCSAGDAVPMSGFGHTGFTGTSVWAEPEEGRIWVLLSNRNHPGQRGVDLHPLRRRFHRLAYPPR